MKENYMIINVQKQLAMMQYQLANNTLNAYLRLLSDIAINETLGVIMMDDIIGDRVKILDAILEEQEYRGKQNKNAKKLQKIKRKM